ncbi:MAG: hypothetical protein PHQ23_07110 [Candidatus Wallbacteria bacterium]|nr:hypothetical protein [Candidatus Wallbacteria bacterium]
MSDKKCPLSQEDLEFLQKYARKIIKRRMEAPAIVFLESMKPLNFIGSQFMIGFQPIIGAFFDTASYDRIQQILEQRESIEIFIRLIEDMVEKRDRGEEI